MSKLSNFYSTIEAAIAAPIVPNTTTENGCLAHSSTGSACLDFFSSIVRDSPAEKVVERFEHAYLEDPHLTLQILLNLRDRDGKQEKLVSFVAASHLRSTRPKTYAMNLKALVDHGCFKDVLLLDQMGKHPLVEDIELKLMAAALMDDAEKLAAAAPEEPVPISLAAKWAPTEGCCFDKKTRAASRLAKYCDLTKREFRKMCASLRSKLDILERYECQGPWEAIDFERIPAVAMKRQRKALERHLPEQYNAYLASVMDGKAKMNSKGVQPHELVRDYMQGAPADPATDAQWHALISRLSEAGLFKDAVAVCDVSGSMSGVPMEVSIALGLVTAELTGEPFKGKVITFSAEPQWHSIAGCALFEKVSSLRQANWGMNTDFIAVFRMLLDEAVRYKLSPEQMIKKVFVFTDMQFDQANNAGRYGTGFNAVKALYDAAGFILPQIVFWNLRDTNCSFPVCKDTPGVALMSGFSSEMLKCFLDDIPMTPFNLMLHAVEKYKDKVVVVDESA